MTAVPDAGAWAWLRSLERRCAIQVAAFRAAEAGHRPRSGVLFEVASRRLLADIDSLAEVLTVPRQMARVPGTADWLLGLANHRGSLLPLVDLAGLLFGRPPLSAPRGYVLVPRGTSAPLGLCVDGVIGLRRYQPQPPDAGPAADDPPAGAGLAGLIVAQGLDGEARLPVVRLAAVERLPDFAGEAPAGARP
jgi:twitching motility protein PilI